MNTVLQAHALGKKYGQRQALADCTLEIPPGHVVGLVGPNGAGKTTLLKIACGMLAPTTGRIEVLGEQPGGGQALRRPARPARPDHCGRQATRTAHPR